MSRKGIPVLDFDDLILALQDLAAPSATDVAVSTANMHYITEDDAQGALAELDAECFALNNSLTQKQDTINLSTPSGTTYATFDKGGYFQIGKLVIIDAVITANSNVTSGQQILSTIPATAINNMPLSGCEVGAINTPTLFRVYTGGIYPNNQLTSGKQYHIYGSYMSL